jgi:hypothetical protein
MRAAWKAIGLLAGLAGCGGGGGEPAPGGESGRKPETPAPAAAGAPEIAGPHVHKNLAVYVVRGKTTDPRDYITLDEGLAAGTVAVLEKGGREGQDRAEVSKLEVENRSDRWLFLQAGDIVKGGKQDRTIGIDIAIAPKSPPKAVDSFCVEHGRWTQGTQGLAFGANSAIASSNSMRYSIQGEKNQGRVWEEVSKQEKKAVTVLMADASPSGRVALPGEAASAPAPASQPMSQRGARTAQGNERSGDFQQAAVAQGPVLSASGTYNAIVENKDIREGREAYVKALMPALEGTPDALGIVVAVNGEILAADVYGSAALFRKLSRKLLDAYALEALLARDPEKPAAAPPPAKNVQTFLAKTDEAEAKDETLAGSMHRRTRDAAKAVLYEYNDAETKGASAPLHRNYLAK